MKPNLFIIGAPKCGTTALAAYLSDHPNIFVCPIKEPFFFDRDLLKLYQMPEGTYGDLFRDADPAVHRVAAEGSTSYLISSVAVPEILKFNPEAKFIVMLRNPLEMLPSYHSQQVFAGRETITDFAAAWRLEESRKQGKNLPFRCLDPKKLFYSEWGKLGDQVERLFSRVPREKVKVILNEELAANARKVYAEVLEFIGVPSDDRRDFPKVNENKKVIWPGLQAFSKILGTYVHNLKSKLGITRRFGLLMRLRNFNWKVKKRDPVPEELRRELRDFYRDDVRKLSGLLGRDLSHWLDL